MFSLGEAGSSAAERDVDARPLLAGDDARSDVTAASAATPPTSSVLMVNEAGLEGGDGRRGRRQQEKASGGRGVWLHRGTWVGRAVLETAAVAGLLKLLDLSVEDKFCDWMFGCGCGWGNLVGGDGWRNCNIHNSGTPWDMRCPFCASPHFGWWADFASRFWHYALAVAVVLILLDFPFAAEHRALRQAQASWTTRGVLRLLAFIARLAFAIASYPVFGAITGLAFKLATGYPYWFGFWGAEAGHAGMEHSAPATTPIPSFAHAHA